MHIFFLPFFLRPHIIAFCPESKRVSSHILSKDESYSDEIKQISLESIPTAFWYASGPAPFTGLRNMSVFLKTLRLVHPNCSFFSFSTAEYLAQCFPESKIQIFSAGKRDCFVCSTKGTELTKNTLFLESFQTDPMPIGFFPESCHEKLTTMLSSSPFPKYTCPAIPLADTLSFFVKNASQYAHDAITIDYGALPRLG